MTHTHRNLAWIAAGAALLAAWIPSFAAPPSVTLSTGKKIEGTAITSNEKGEIILTTAQGQMTFPKGTPFRVDAPADYTKAQQALKINQFDEVIRLARTIMREYANLHWDVQSRRLLAPAYLGKKDYLNAVKAYEELFTLIPETRKDNDTVMQYMDAIVGSRDEQRLDKALDPFIAEGPRNVAARAQVIRGNRKFATGEIEAALMDFLRTAEFFKDEADAMPEALFRAGECLEKLADKRATGYFERVSKEYPTSPFAAQARRRVAAP